MKAKALRQDRQLLLDHAERPLGRLCALRRLEGRDARPDQVARSRARPHGICVNAVSPGAVVSEAEARVFADRLQQYNDWILENQCLKTRIQPENVAELVLFLVSPASDMITGQNFPIDGGW